jgi:hypothetical protein
MIVDGSYIATTIHDTKAVELKKMLMQHYDERRKTPL